MGLPHLTGTAEVIDQPSLSYQTKGRATTLVRLRFDSKVQDRTTGAWVDGDHFEVSAILFGRRAQAVADNIAKGDQVMVVGRIKTDQMNVEGGGQIQVPVLFIDSIGSAY